jgi:hypothetical protein
MLIEGSIRVEELNISHKDIFIAMGYRNDTPDADVVRLVDEVLSEVIQIGVIRYMYFVAEAQILSDTDIKIGDTTFSLGGNIGRYLQGMQKACLYVSTVGAEIDSYIQELKGAGDILKEFVADAVGTVLAELSSSLITQRLEETYNLKVSAPYSPGYCGWDIKEQRLLFSMFPDTPCGITLSDTFLMSPVKSVSGFFGLGNGSFQTPKHCDLCNNLNCFKRRTTI